MNGRETLKTLYEKWSTLPSDQRVSVLMAVRHVMITGTKLIDYMIRREESTHGKSGEDK